MALGCLTGPPAYIGYIGSGGPVKQPYAIVDFIPQSGTMNLATDCREGKPVIFCQVILIELSK